MYAQAGVGIRRAMLRIVRVQRLLGRPRWLLQRRLRQLLVLHILVVEGVVLAAEEARVVEEEAVVVVVVVVVQISEEYKS